MANQFKKISETQFSFNDEIFTLVAGVEFEKIHGDIVKVGKYDECRYDSTAFSPRDFAQFISPNYNGDENFNEWFVR